MMINVDILDMGLLKAIDPELAGRYLRHHGWEKVKDSYGQQLWNRVLDNEQQRLRVPTHLDDQQDESLNQEFAELMQRFLRYLAQIEGRSQLEILSDFETVAQGDVIRLRELDPNNPKATTIPFSRAQALVNRGYKMAAASASAVATKERRKLYTGKRLTEAEEYLNQLRMGQTERGSYIIQLISPITEQVSIDDETPFSRQVVVDLMSSLDVIKKVLEPQRRQNRFVFEAFEEAVSDGVNGTLCSGIAELEEDLVSHNPFEVSVSWSLLDIRPPLNVPTEIYFEPESLIFIHQAAQRFREKPRVDQKIYVKGSIISLNRKESNGPGIINVQYKGNDSKKYKTIKVSLDAADYLEASNAHGEGWDVSFHGIFHAEEENQTVLRDYSGFRVYRGI